jgi:hypothetical protein
MPIALSSNGYQSMLDDFEERAPGIYGAWCALVAVAATCAVRGLLANSRGQALKVGHIARRTGFDAATLTAMIQWAAMPEIGWLEALTEAEAADEIAKKAGKPADLDIVECHSTITQEIPGSHSTITQQIVELQLTATEPNITKHQQQLASLPAAAAANSVLKDFASLDWQEVCRSAARLDKACPTLDSGFVWTYAWISELLKPGFFSEVATGIKTHKVSKPKAYIEKAMRGECTEQGVDLAALIAQVPSKPVKAERVGS